VQIKRLEINDTFGAPIHRDPLLCVHASDTIHPMVTSEYNFSLFLLRQFSICVLRNDSNADENHNLPYT